MRGQRRRYNPVAAEEDQVDDQAITAAEAGVQVQNEIGDSVNDETKSVSENELDDATPAPQEGFTVKILDFAHSNFEVPASPHWTVKQLKAAGTMVHKVSVNRQRLIFQGKLLAEDDKTLQEYGIKETETIVHLFPKPRVVITNSSNATDEPGHGDDEEVEGGGARVPTIVMDATEAERRAEILVLGSPDFLEAQNNVKLFSFMLLLISSIELLNLLGIAMGVPQDGPIPDGETNTNHLDDTFPESNISTTSSFNADEQDAYLEMYNHWGWPQTVNTFVSMLGLYVAFLGLKATSENTLRVARQYMLGLFAAGAAWLVFRFFFMVAVERKSEEWNEQEHEHSHDDDFERMSDRDIYSQALQVMILPALVWSMCWVRACHFHSLLHEAEREATARMETQVRENEEIDANNDEDFALRSEDARLT